MQCLQFATQLGRHYPQFQQHNTAVLIIGGGPLSRAEFMAKNQKLPFPILADLDHTVYEQYGLVKKLILIQESATVVIDQQGIIRYIKRVTNPQAWFGNEELNNLMKAVEALEFGTAQSG